jgi:peroxiredoxin
MKSATLLAAVVLGAFTVWITARAKATEEDAGTRAAAVNAAGKDAPALTLPSLEGRTISLSDYRGKKTVVIAYWASWCSPCRAEIPILNRLYNRGHATVNEFEVLAVSVDEDRAEAEKFAKETGMTFPVLLDPGRHTIDAFHVDNVPSLIVVDPAGKIVYGHSGFDQRTGMDLAGKLGFPGRFGGMDGRTGN